MQDVSTEHKHQVTTERGRKRIGQGGNKDKTHKGPMSPERPEAEFVISKLSVNLRWLECYFYQLPSCQNKTQRASTMEYKKKTGTTSQKSKHLPKKFEFDRRPSDFLFDQLLTNCDVNQKQVRTQDSIFNARCH